MLDSDDLIIIQQAKQTGAVFVTWDRVVRTAAGGITPYEALEQVKLSGKGTPEAQAEVSRLHALKPVELTAMADAGNRTYQYFRDHIEVKRAQAKLIRKLRVEKDLSWRAIARFGSKLWGADWGSNQLAGMVMCDKSASLMGEDFMKPPWN